MSHVCTRPCPVAFMQRNNLVELRNHLAEGHRCADAWVALAHLLHAPWQRVECLERAAAIAPDDLALRIAYLEHYVALHPDDAEAAADLRATRARRAITGYKPRIFRYQDATAPLGAILCAIGATTYEDIELALEEQDRLKRLGHPVLLGDLLVARGKITPEVLARALILQFRVRATNGAAPQVLGEYLIAEGRLQPEQLERALVEQIRLRQAGAHEPLGEILLRHGAVDVSALQHAYQKQMRDTMAAYV